MLWNADRNMHSKDHAQELQAVAETTGNWAQGHSGYILTMFCLRPGNLNEAEL